MTEHEIPNSAIEALARCLLPAIQSFFESEESQREYAEWKAQQNMMGATEMVAPC
jgi:hypothetical protein